MSDGPAGQRILVTGGAGFIGSHLTAALLDQNEVRVLDDFSDGSRSNIPQGAEVIEGDVCDPHARQVAMKDVNLVFHEAAQTDVGQSVEAPHTSQRINIGGTVGILEQARREDAAVVLASSAAIYGDPEVVPITEEHGCNPCSPYGIEKLAADHYTRMYADLYGLRTVSLRYFNVYGRTPVTEDGSGVIAHFLRQALNDPPITIHGDGNQTRDFIHLDDVVEATITASKVATSGEAYNIGSGTRTSIQAVAETIAALTNDTPIVHIDSRPGDIRHSQADVTKAQDELGFTADVRLRDGIKSLVSTTQRVPTPSVTSETHD